LLYLHFLRDIRALGKRNRLDGLLGRRTLRLNFNLLFFLLGLHESFEHFPLLLYFIIVEKPSVLISISGFNHKLLNLVLIEQENICIGFWHIDRAIQVIF
jgi:hypothetical protein